MQIDTKEEGKKRLKFLGTQNYFVDEVAEGLNRGIHEFIVLKGRQLGISTISIALDIYWNFKYEGLQGSLITDTEENRDQFRSIIEMYMESLPATHRIDTVRHNRTHMILENRSRFAYQVAGTRKKGGLGRGKGLNFIHATECSSWGDEEGFASLVASLAQLNPHRLYVFESTARGYNGYYKQWQIAKESEFKKAIFIGWWRNELYSFPKGSAYYNIYWDGILTKDEKCWVSEVKELYDFDIQPEQIVWWRWCNNEQIKDDMLMLQEYPPTEDYAFQLTGSKFFSAQHVNQEYKKVRDQSCRYHKYRTGIHFEHTQFQETNERNAELTVWEYPDPEGHYVIGADPAYGSSEWADRFVASVWRCYADRVILVAEYCTDEINTYEFAWVLAHLCGNYEGALLNLEINGPGQAVFNELMNLARLTSAKAAVAPNIYDVVSGIRHYLYRRQDSMGGAFAYQWQMNHREKERAMNTLRDYFERGMLEINSAECLLEFRNIVRNDGCIGGEGEAKDDRVIAAALAIIAWNDHLMIDLATNGITWAAEQARRNVKDSSTILSNQVMHFLKDNVFAPARQEDDDDWVTYDPD